MTTKQDYLNSIVQGLARIKLSDPTETTLQYLDEIVHVITAELDPNRDHVLEDTEWAHFILQAETEKEAWECFQQAEYYRLGRN